MIDEYAAIHEKWMLRMFIMLTVMFFMLVTVICVAGSANHKVKELEARMSAMEREHEEIEAWIEDNRTVMQTYKFFNKSWQAILDKEGIKWEGQE